MSIASLLPAMLIVFLLLWAFTRFYLRGENLSRYDQAAGSLMKPISVEPSDAHYDVIELVEEMRNNRPANRSLKEQIPRIREDLDKFSAGVSLEGVRVQPVAVEGVHAEWVMADDADPKRRLLYIHGGAFVAGSPISHRSITAKLARSNGTSVLAIDYRLLPEHKRLDCLADCQTAYRWILDNGPDGPSAAETLFVAGDSAGGNLTLAVIAWARDQGLKAANGVIALSPAIDGTCSAPSLRKNISTDPMIGPSFGKLMTMPNWAFLWYAFLSNRLPPCDPRLSPIHGDLANLPPILIHVSEAEMMLDDSRRYVNKATACGTEATLEVWPHMLHVWHIFHDKMPEAQEAFKHIEKFITLNSPSNG